MPLAAPSSPPIDRHDPAGGATSSYRLEAATGAWQVSGEQLHAVAQHDGLVALPWPLPDVLGLVTAEEGPLAALAPCCGTPPADCATPAPLIAILNSEKGRVAVPVNKVSLIQAGTPTAASDHAGLTHRLADWTPAGAARPQRSPAPGQSVARLQFVHVRTGDCEWAIPAAEVELIGKCEASVPLGPEEPHFRLIEADGTTLVGESLAWRMGRPPAPDEPWFLLGQQAGARTALLVEAVLGLIEAEARHLVVLRHGPRPGAWLTLPGRTPITVPDFTLDPNLPETASTQALPTTTPTGTAKAVRLDVGATRLVLPAAMVASIPGPAGTLAPLTQRAAGALPVIDLAAMFSEAGAPGDFAVRARLGRQDVVLLCQHAVLLDLGDDWHPLPALPPPCAGLFDAVRLQHGQATWRVAEQPTRAALRQLFALAVRPPFRGWLAPHSL